MREHDGEAEWAALGVLAVPALVLRPAEGQVVWLNRRAREAMLGDRARDPWSAVECQRLAACGLDPLRVAATDAAALTVRFETADAVRHWHLAIERRGEGETISVVLYATDVTAFVAAAAGRKRPEARLESAILDELEVLAEAGYGVYDPAVEGFACSEGLERIWDFAGADAPRYSDFLAKVHPEDRSALLASGGAVARRAQEFRVVRPDGAVRYLARRHVRLPGGDGRERIAVIDRDCSELRRIEKELGLTKIAAEAASAAKAEFLACMSHELRTPLNAIMGFSEVMAQELFGSLSPRYLEYSEQIHGSARHLLDLITDILDLSRIEASQYELSKDWIDVGKIVTDAVRMMQARATLKSVQLASGIEGVSRAWASSRALKQVMLNLLSNAIKFTPPGGRVDVDAWTEADGTVAIRVADTGIGIPEEDIGRVCQPFIRSRNATEIAEGGTGLGLAIVSSLIELHGGHTVVRSTLGAGTSVTVTLQGQAAPDACDKPRLAAIC